MSALGRAALAFAALAWLIAPAGAAELAAQRPGVTDVYFVGFAAWGGQDVFLSEARGASEVVAKAYDSPDRATLLSNEAGAGLPVADAGTLRAALAKVAKTMDPSEDVLFLLVTSHGSRKGAGLQRGGADDEAFGLLTPQELRRSLDAAGVKHAVVVVSACYSGVFRKIATPDRLVIMAARPDRPSFGCRDGNRWTYFGEAFFDAALRRQPDPLRAFADAKAIVSKREIAEGFTPSEPQVAGGKRVAKKISTAAQH